MDVTAPPAPTTTDPQPDFVLAWFPGDLLCNDPAASGWELHPADTWSSGGPGDRIAGAIDATADELRASVAEAVGPVTEFRRGTWRVESVGEGEHLRVGPWTYPAFDVRTADR